SLNEKLNNIYRLQPEKIWLHTDRSVYVPGDTLFFSAKITLGDMPSPESTVLYAELWDAEGKKIGDNILPIAYAHSQGAFIIENNSKSSFLLRAYTTNSILHSPFSFAQKIILFSSDTISNASIEPIEELTKITIQH